MLHFRSKACPGWELNSDGFIRYKVFKFVSEVKRDEGYINVFTFYW